KSKSSIYFFISSSNGISIFLVIFLKLLNPMNQGLLF
ncbi:putative membrane protein, partial [Escherichia coli EC4196]